MIISPRPAGGLQPNHPAARAGDGIENRPIRNHFAPSSNFIHIPDRNFHCQLNMLAVDVVRLNGNPAAGEVHSM
jgi:hypothetical protein